MRIVRFNRETETKWGIIEDEMVHGLAGNPFDYFAAGIEFERDGGTCPQGDIRLLCPCLPGKIVCLGVNYRRHADEMDHILPTAPLLFLKPSTAVIGPDDNILLPLNWRRVDFEGELGVVIGKKARYVSEDESGEYILGYTCFNDVTERSLQKEDGQWTRAKGFDTFAPAGPWIETGIDAGDLKLETYLNGELRQSARTSELIFGIPCLVSFISSVMTLMPGDIIATGTPSGIAPMKPGDVVEVKIEKIGTLRNAVYQLAKIH
ncbi:MAG: fumarylacetoacetate hydrolase family protein [Dehalococcoidales bacterium]|nr:fumarylacetoacetate hydrolase family protein [Dehalococcoidales bacterium]